MFVVARLGVMLLTLAAAGAAVVGPWALAATTDGEPSTATANRMARRVMASSMAGGLVALTVLAWAFLAEDWRFATVVGHARPDVPWTLRVAAIWAGPEGSLLVWTMMLATAAFVVFRLSGSHLPGRILAATTAAYGIVVLSEADPFERLAAPPGAGNGLQPVLEHPAMLWHPPVLYLGLIGMLIPAALSIGNDSETQEAVAWTLPSALALLTAGLATGANWAHVELGWGGYWAWDPIENAGLVAWLAGASALHRLDPRNGRPEAVPWPRPLVAVMMIPGVAAVWATTITRTGVLNSVHAFADRPTLRLMLITIAVTFTAVAAVLAWRAPATPDPEAKTVYASRSRAGWLVVGVATIVVAVGTYEPAVERLVRDESFILSGRFYSVLLWPVALGAAVLRVRAAVRASAVPNRVLGSAVTGSLGAMIVVTASTGAAGLALAAAGGAVVGSALFERQAGRSDRPGRLTHVGIGLLIVGIAGTTATVSETVVVLTEADATTSIGTVNHRGVDLLDVRGTRQAVATLEISTEDRTRTFQPKLVTYPATGGQSSEVDTDRGWLADTQVVLIDADADRATYRLSVHPRISLVWLGAAVTAIGLTASALGRLRSRSRLEPRVERPIP